MIEPDDVAAAAPNSRAAPTSRNRAAQHVPAVHGISPALAGFGEGIRRHAGDDLGLEIGIEAEDIGMRPDIGAVIADEDGDVADDADALLRRRRAARATAQRTQTAGNARGRVRRATRRAAVSSWDRGARAGAARGSSSAVKTAAQGIEQDEIFQPPGVVGKKRSKRARCCRGAEQKPAAASPAAAISPASRARSQRGPAARRASATRSCEINPRSARRSRLISRTLPAKAEVEE